MRDMDLYVVTDEKAGKGKSHCEIARLCFEGGADIVQLRAKDSSDGDIVAMSKIIRKYADEHGGLFIVDDRVSAAVEGGAHGVHLGQSDMPVSEAREIVPEGFIVGISVDNAEQAVAAVRDGADYVALSPVHDTMSKGFLSKGFGLDELRRVRAAVDVPVVAIGGMDMDTIPGALANGADVIALISAVVSKDDIASAAAGMKEFIRTVKTSGAPRKK
ncbi:MAG: thiamine phosphate synthase [Thermoplasmatales archaeon]|nr:thiamine phosphate synthase [Thermoplasmatales archaeon]